MVLKLFFYSGSFQAHPFPVTTVFKAFLARQTPGINPLIRWFSGTVAALPSLTAEDVSARTLSFTFLFLFFDLCFRMKVCSKP